MYRVVVFLLCVSALHAGPAFQDCGSKVGHYKSITVSNCDETQQNCILRRNTNATIEIEFYVDNDVSAVNSIVHGVLSGLPVPFPISHPDACKDADSGLKCPLAKNAGPYTYTSTLFVENSYPKISLKVRWELQDQNSNDIVCVEIPAKIQ